MGGATQFVCGTREPTQTCHPKRSFSIFDRGRRPARMTGSVAAASSYLRLQDEQVSSTADMPSIWADAPDAPDAPAAPTEPGAPAPALASPPATERPPSAEPRSQSGEPEAAPAERVRAPPRIREQFGGGLKTAGDAYAVCEALFYEQLDRAAVLRPVPNTPIVGDGSARTAFLLLLTDGQQRELFLDFASKPVTWPRLKPLVGAPPYHFLQPQDAGVLNAAGFARGRAHMTYESGSRVANHQQFGPGQLIDEHTREYRVAPRQLDPSDPLPGTEYFQLATKDLVLQVKVKRHGVQKKRELFHSEFKKQLLFPQPGETIVLRESERLLSARGLRQASSTRLRVKALWPRSQGSSTAAVLVGF